MSMNVSIECNSNVERQVCRDDSRDSNTNIFTLSAAHDEQQLRAALLQMILKNEARRRGLDPARNLQDAVTTEGSASRQIESAES
jgi:hypothetical protein